MVDGPGPQADSLLAFMSILGQQPDPAQVAQSLVTGPLSAYGAQAAMVAEVSNGRLEAIGHWGYPEGAVEPWSSLPLDIGLPITRSVRENEVIIDITSEMSAEYPGLRAQAAAWESLQQSVTFGTVVTAPIVLRGLAIGAIGFNCVASRAWNTLEIASLDALSAVLGLWLSHPDTPGTLGSTHPAVTSRVSLTARQRAILARVGEGRSTAAIARDLAVSESTVKQDLARAVRALGASSRTEAARIAEEYGVLR